MTQAIKLWEEAPNPREKQSDPREELTKESTKAQELERQRPSSPPPPWYAAELPKLTKEIPKSPEEAQEIELTQAVKLMEETALRGETTKQEDDAKLLKEMTFGTLKFCALEGSDLEHSHLEHYGVSRDVQKLPHNYRSSQDIIVIL